jgi:hypothetical protein
VGDVVAEAPRRSSLTLVRASPACATFKQRNGYGLDDLVERSLTAGRVTELVGGDEQNAMVGHPSTAGSVARRPGRSFCAPSLSSFPPRRSSVLLPFTACCSTGADA